MLFIALIVCIVVALVAAQLPPNLEETFVAMRDGTKLHTMVFYPKGVSEGKKYPAVIDRSPYGYTDLEWVTDIFVPFGFVAIGQDMRGTEKSEGNFTMWQSDADDSRDLGDWIVQQPWSNGKVYTLGASADGIESLQTPKTEPSWLAGQYIIWATSRMYEVLFPYGTYKQKTAEDWLLGVTMPTPEVVNDNIQTVHENEAHTPYWDGVELGIDTFQKVKYPNAFWGGWYDLFSLGTLQAFDGYNNHADESVRYTSKITIDPLGHCLDYAFYFTQNAPYGRTAVIFAQMFETFGIRPVKRSQIRNVTFYVMSSNDDAGKQAGMYWTSLEKFPTPVMTNYYLHADKTASVVPPTTIDSTTTYKYDPADPAPTMGGNNLPDSIGGTIPCGPMDNSEVDKRSDVLAFQTEVFDKELALTGPLMATLYVSSDAIDTDFTVKISDVYPTGESHIIQDNAVRMRWREGGVEPVYMQKNKVYEITMNLWNTSFIVPPGHALRFSISSSNYPRFSVNPNNGLLLKDPQYPGVNITANNVIYHSARYPSRITLPVVSKFQIPEVHLIKEAQEMYPILTDDFLKKHSASLDKLAKRMKRYKKN
jgi:hypothetical protein